jgi:hypothetical protein
MTTLCLANLTNCTPMKPVVSMIKHANEWMDSVAIRSRFEPGNRLPRDVMGLFKTHIN